MMSLVLSFQTSYVRQAQVDSLTVTGRLRYSRIPHANLYPSRVIGINRNLSPVAANTALQIAGKIGGSAGSPSPVGGWGDSR
jgi:hypothetical protein